MLLQFGLQKFIISAPRDLGDTRLQSGQTPGDRVGDKFGRADTKFAAFSEIGARFNRRKKLVHFIDKVGR